MDFQFEGESEFHVNPRKMYYCSPTTISSGLNLLMKLILQTKKYPYYEDIIMHLINNTPHMVYETNDKGFTPLMIAVRNYNTYCTYNTISMLVYSDQNSILINKTSNEGLSALHYIVGFCESGDINDVVKLLINNGADINIKTNNGYTPLMLCLWNNYNNYINNINNINSIYETAKLLIDTNYINICDIFGNTALIFAVNKFMSNVIKLLLDNGADVNVQNKRGITALMYAVKYSANPLGENIVDMLIKYGADVNISDNNGWTPLKISMWYYNTTSSNRTVQMLLSEGAEIRCGFVYVFYVLGNMIKN